MPHFIIEYSRDLEADAKPDVMMRTAHEVALASGQFKESDIKIRLLPFDHSYVAGKTSPMLHVTVYLLAGRDRQTKKALTQALVARFDKLAPSVCSISANAIDMDRETYSKVTH